jgi:hypothetical protein
MSVNGRPFRPDPTSYEVTGIPCGHPSRYKSRGVIRTTRNPNVPFEDQKLGSQEIQKTAADLELQRLLQTQLDTSYEFQFLHFFFNFFIALNFLFGFDFK